MLLFFCRHCQKQVTPQTSDNGQTSVCPECGHEIHVSTFLYPGTIVGGFMVENEIGRGGMGIVYKAKQLKLERRVALKTLSDDLSRDNDFVERFFAEARAAANLSHPNVVQVFDAGSTIDGICYFAMELIEGETLENRIKREGRLKQKAGLDIATKIAAALDYAWKKQCLTHGDIKPDNIILNSSGEVKLADLGLAKSIYDKESSAPMMGTPLYIAPEIIAGASDISHLKCDFYSFGATLYHMFSGTPPFSGKDAEDIMSKHLNEDPVPLSKINPAAGPMLSELILRLLAKNPEFRPESWEEILNALNTIAEKERKIVKRGSSWPILSASQYRIQLPDIDDPDYDRKRKLVLYGVIASLLAVLAIVILAVVIIKSSYSSKKNATSVVSVSGKSGDLDWPKVKNDIQFMSDEEAIVRLNAYITENRETVPDEAGQLLLRIKTKIKEKEQAAQALVARKLSVNELAESLLRKLDQDYLKKLSLKTCETMKTSMDSILKDKSASSLVDPVTLSMLADAAPLLDSTISVLRQKEKDEQVRKAKAEADAVAERKRLEEQKKKDAENALRWKNREDYFAAMSSFVDIPVQDRNRQSFEKAFASWLSRQPANSNQIIRKTVPDAIKSPMTIIVENEESFKGLAFPGAAPEYKFESADDKGVKVATSELKGKIGRKIPWAQISFEQQKAFLQQLLDQKSEINQKLAVPLVIFELFSNGHPAENLAASKLPPEQKTSLEAFIKDFNNAGKEVKASELWKDATQSLLKHRIAETAKAVNDLHENYADTEFFNNRRNEIVATLKNAQAASPENPASALLKRSLQSLEKKSYFRALYENSSALSRYGNLEYLRKDTKAELLKSRVQIMDALQAAYNGQKNRPPLPFVADYVPQPWLCFFLKSYEGVSKMSKAEKLFFESAASLDSGDWMQARDTMAALDEHAMELVKSKSENREFFLPLLLYAGLLADRYDNHALQAKILKALKSLAASEGAKALYMESAASYAAGIRDYKEAAILFDSYKPELKNPVYDLRFVVNHFSFKLNNSQSQNPQELSGEIAASLLPYSGLKQLSGDIVWLNAAAAILNGSFKYAPSDIKALDDAKLRNSDTLASFMADVLALSMCSSQTAVSGSAELMELLEGKLSAGTPASSLWKKLAMLELSKSIQDIQKTRETLNNLLNDARLSALPSYPGLLLMKMAADSASSNINGDILKGNYRMFIKDASIASESDSAMALVFTSDDPVSVIADMVESSPENAFYAGVAAYFVNKGRPETSKRILAKLKELQRLFSWEERLCIKNLE